MTGNTTTLTTPITPALERLPAKRMDPFTEALPIPLMILGDITTQCRELYKYLSASDKNLYVRATDSELESQASTEVPMAATSSLATPEFKHSTSYSSNSLLVPRPSKSDTSCSSHDSREDSDVGGSGEWSELYQSSSYVRRTSVSQSLFNSSNNLPPSPTTTPVRQPVLTTLHSTSSSTTTGPPINKRYVLGMFTQEMDRKFIHVFLRQSGVYLVVVGLRELIDDPAIQFENLSFWLRLLQIYVGPSDGIKRVIIVGMTDSPVTSEKGLHCLKNLEGALADSNFQHLFSTDKDGTPSVVIFNRQDIKASLNHLSRCIVKCTDLMIKRVQYIHPNLHESVFQPFSGLSKVLMEVNRHSNEVLMSADSLLSLYEFADPNYFETLAAYSPACISFDDRGM